MKMYLTRRGIGLLALAGATVTALGSPILSIGDMRSTSWTAGGVKVASTTSVSAPVDAFYTGEAAGLGLPGYMVDATSLTRDLPVSDGSMTKSSLVTSFDTSGMGKLDVSEWEYDYDADPDFSNTTIHFTAYAPPVLHSLGIELIDAGGRSRAWFRHNLDFHWDETYQLDPMIQSTQGVFDRFIQDPGFQLGNVLTVRFNVASDPRQPFPIPDPSPFRKQRWAAYGYLDIVPEPGTYAAMASGLLGLSLLSRRSKTR